MENNDLIKKIIEKLNKKQLENLIIILKEKVSIDSIKEIKDITMNKNICCDDMEFALNNGFITIRLGDYLINHFKTPKSAGNVITGEIYDSNDFAFGMALKYCPSCKTKLKVVLEDCQDCDTKIIREYLAQCKYCKLLLCPECIETHKKTEKDIQNILNKAK